MKLKQTAITLIFLGLVACGSDTNSASSDKSSESMKSSETELSSERNSSIQDQSSSSARRSANLSSSSFGLSETIQSSSLVGVSNIFASSSIGNNSQATPSSSKLTSSTGGTSIVTPSSSAGGTSIITPSSNSTTGSVTWQGKTYRTTNIDGKMWFAENLDYGTQVSASSGQVNSGAVEKSCYDDIASNCTTYGGLYTWAEAMALPSTCNTTSCAGSINTPHQGICPDGWHIPTGDDFNKLLSEVGVSSIAGKYLKSQTGWPAGNNGTDEYGFSALPSGLYESSFYFLQEYVLWWEVDEGSITSKAYQFDVGAGSSISNTASNKSIQVSIRCVKN